MILLVVAPVLQFKLPLQPLALNIALSPKHNISLFVTMIGVIGFSLVLITIGVDDELLPQALLQVAVYVTATFTSIIELVAPVLHVKLPTQPLAFNLAFSPSQQIVLSLVIIGALGLLVWLITIGLLAKLLPQALLHVAV